MLLKLELSFPIEVNDCLYYIIRRNKISTLKFNFSEN